MTHDLLHTENKKKMLLVYEKNYKIINDAYCVVDQSTGSKIFYKHHVCAKCYKNRDGYQYNFNEISIQNDNQLLLRDLIKPCSVYIRRLNLLGHNGDGFSNCCLPFQELNISEKFITNKVDKMDHGNSMSENRLGNLSLRDKDPIQNKMDSLFESLCETFNLINAKKKEHKKTTKVCGVFSSCNSKNPEIQSSKELISNLHQGKNPTSETSKVTNPSVINFSHNYKTSHPPMNKSGRKKLDLKESSKNVNENRRHSYEGTDSEIENEAPSQLDIRSMQIRYLSSSEVPNNNTTKTCEIPKIDSGLFLDRRNNYSAPLASSTTKIFSRFLPKSNLDKAIKANDLPFSLNNSNPESTSKPKIKDFENGLDGNQELEIDLLKIQKNIKNATKNVSKENFVHLLNHKRKSIEKADNAVIEDSENEIEILGENVFTRKKPADDECAILINEKSLGSENENTLGNKQIKILNKIVQPCSVLIELMDEKFLKSYCNNSQRVVRDETNNHIPLIETVNGCTTDSCLPSSVLLISSRSTVGTFTARNEQAFKGPEKVPLIKPCSVLIDKLPLDKCQKFINPKRINSLCYKNASFHIMIDETERNISEGVNMSQFKKKNCPPSPDCVSFSTLYNPNIDAVSKPAVIRKQTKNKPRKAPSVKLFSNVIQNLSIKKELLAKKRSMNKQYNFSKFKKHFMTFNGRKQQFFRKKNIFKSSWISNRIHLKKLDKPFVFKKWKKESQVLEQAASELKKGVQVKEDLNINVDAVSSTLFKENQHIYCTSSDISPKCLSSNFRTDSYHVLLERINMEDFNVNNCKNVTEVSSKPLIENQHICSKSSNTCPLSDLATNNCFVLLEDIKENEYLVGNRNSVYNKYGLKYSTSSNVFFQCSESNFRLRDCSVLLERINVYDYLVETRDIFKQPDLSIYYGNRRSKPEIKNQFNRYKTEENFQPNSRLKLKRRGTLTAEDASKLDIKKLKKMKDFCTFEKNMNLICHSDYKCVQCRKSISSDVELYYHRCCGKRKNGYICDICEKIFESIPGHKKHVNYHYKFIS